MEPALDAGPLISEIIFSSDEYKTLGELRNEMGALMPIIAVDSVISILSDTAQPIKQKPSGQQYYFIHHRLRECLNQQTPEKNEFGIRVPVVASLRQDNDIRYIRFGHQFCVRNLEEAVDVLTQNSFKASTSESLLV